MKQLIAAIALTCLVSLQAVGAEAAKDRTGWKHHGVFYVLTTQDGANIPAQTRVHNFPVLVRINDDFFDFGEAQPDGGDLRFASMDGAELAYEIDGWAPATGAASVWVRIPVIKGNDVQPVTVYWGNPDCPDASDGKAVFNASNGFVGVWHLGSGISDATGNTATKDTGTTTTSGIIGEARRFPGGKGVFCGDNIEVFPTGGTPHSTEVWFRTKTTNARIVSWGQEKARGKVQMWYRSPPSIRMDCYFSNGGLQAKLPGRPDDWTHVVHTYEDDKAILYVNGKKVGTGNPRQARMNIERPARMWIGGWYNRYDFVGDIDEVRVSNVARSPEWVHLEHENQRRMQTLVGPIVIEGESFGLTPSRKRLNEGESIDFIAKADGAQKIYWILVRDGVEQVVGVDTLSYRFDTGRITGDASAVVKLKAIYPGENKTSVSPITVREFIPDPVVSLVAPEKWDGRETIEVEAKLSNSAAMQACGAGEVDYTWNVSGIATIQHELPGKLILTRAQGSGSMTITTTVHNGGAKVSASKTIHVQEPASDPWVHRTPDPDEKPMGGQFYARDDSGKGVMYFNGRTDREADSVFVKLYADGKLVDQQTKKTSKGAAYSFAIPLKAGLIKYKMELGFKTGATETIVHAADDMVCGDAYLIDGQSNALATDTKDESPRETYEWVRSFGGPTGRGDAGKWVENDFEKNQLNLWCHPVWKFDGGAARQASRDRHKAELGWWGMVLARKLVQSQKVPICIIQAAIGGTRIDEHQRNEADPTDLSTMYGRMLWRVREAKLTHGIRAIMWHQGENDQGGSGPDGGYGWETYQRYFIDMSSGWKRDFPNVSKYYIFQIWPNSCSMGGGNGDMLREVQRTLPRYYSNMSILSTLGVTPPGPAHFPLEGWAVFADMLQPLMESDFYGRKIDRPLTAPNLKRAFQAGSNRVCLEFDQPVAWKPDLVNEFRLNGKKGLVASGSAQGDVITLQLKAPLQAEAISYVDELNWRQDRLIVGANGIAALSFCNVPVVRAR